jgi:hypothetical protein
LYPNACILMLEMNRSSLILRTHNIQVSTPSNMLVSYNAIGRDYRVPDLVGSFPFTTNERRISPGLPEKSQGQAETEKGLRELSSVVPHTIHGPSFPSQSIF